MALERVGTDVVADDLLGVYAQGMRRLEHTIGTGLRRGLSAARAGTPEAKRGDATQAYRSRQLTQARQIVGELRRHGEQAAPVVASKAYRATLNTVDRLGLGDVGTVLPQFGGVHQRAVAVLAGNLSRSLTEAADNMGRNIETVFARAAELDGGLPVRGGPGPASFIGRRTDDAWRRLALEELASGTVALDTRRQITASLADRLVRDGVGDALTGFVDRSGKRWGLDTYAEMVTRTTTREATSRATVNRLTEHGLGLVTISSHPHAADVCSPYDGKTFALAGTPEAARGRYPILNVLAPFHPRCRHVVTPANANLEDFERLLEEEADAAGAATKPPPPDVADRPRKLTPEDRIRETVETERLASQERYITEYSGADPDKRRMIRNRRDAGEDLNNYQSATLELEDRARQVIADHGGQIPGLGESLLDEVGVRNVGAKVRQLVTRRRRALDKKYTPLRRELNDRNDAIFTELAGMERRPGNTRWVELEDELRANERKLKELGNAYRLEHEATAKDVLAKVRPGFGEGKVKRTVTLERTRGGPQADAPDIQRLERDLDAAQELLPREWVARSNDLETLTGQRLRVEGSAGRAHYNSGTHTIRNRPGDTSVMLHELGHRIEQVVPHIRRLEFEFYVRRTRKRGGSRYELERAQRLADLTGRNYGDKELARPDKFTTPYIGKAYGPAGQPGTSDFYEVLTMGLEGIYHGRHNIAADKDLEDFIYGLLAAG